VAASSQLPRIHELYGPQFRLSVKGAEDLHQQSADLFYRGDYAGAIRAAAQALKITEDSLGANHGDIAVILTTLAGWRSATQDLEQVADLLKRALLIGELRLGTNHPVVARTLVGLATFDLVEGKIPAAEALLARCLRIQERFYGTNHAALACTLSVQAMTLLAEGKITDAEVAARRASEILEAALGPDNFQYALSLHVQGQIALGGADFTAALDFCQRSKAVLKRAVGLDHFVSAQINSTLALIHQQLGDDNQALAVLERNVLLLEKTLGQDNLQVAAAFNSVGLLHYALGEPLLAEESFRRCLAIREKNLGSGTPAYAAAVNNLALVLIERGREAEASTLFKDAAIMLEKTLGKNSPELATTLCNWGVLSESLGDLDIAKSLYEEAVTVRDRVFGEHHPATAESLARYASLQLRMGNTKYALKLADRSLVTRRRFFKENHPVIADSLDLLARIHMAGGEYEQAVSLLSQSAAIRLHCQGVFHPSLAATLENTALACQAMGEYPLALQSLAQTFPMRRFLLTSQFGKTGDAEVRQIAERSYYRSDLFHSLLLAAPHIPETAVSWRGAEQSAQNKAVMEELEVNRAALEADKSTATRHLREAYQSVQARISALATGESDEIVRESKRRALQDELAAVEANLAERLAILPNRIRERQFTILDVASSLPPNSCLVDLVQFKRYDFAAKTDKWREGRYAGYLTFALPQQSTNPSLDRVDMGPSAPIDETIDFICGRLSAGQYAARDLATALVRLSDMVYGPLAKHLTNISHLIVCPDGQLSRLPFELLSHEGRFLIEDKTISYVGSGREIARLAGGPKSKVQHSKSLVMGNPDFDLVLSSLGVAGDLTRKSDTNARLPKRSGAALASALSRDYRGIKFLPLPGAEAEARSVARLLGKDTILKVRADAREAALKAVVSPRVLHLATHGFFLSDQEFRPTNGIYDGLVADGGLADWRTQPGEDWENPLVRCGIALAGANHASQITNAVAENGLLTGLEASLLNLQGTELVILSACNSGAGEVRIGEGVMSLRRAFRIAGAETVLASHWKVSDESTRLLMTEFMRRWRSGEPRAKAWREAQLSLLHSKDFSNPYFWASFTLTGQWR